MDVQRIASFSNGAIGGNPAGVVLLAEPVEESEMARVAADVGFSETAFAVRLDDDRSWRVRYFSPESEVPFCGHATIALGAALGERVGPGSFDLTLNDASITVEAKPGTDGSMSAILSSPPTHSGELSEADLADSLELFGLAPEDLDPRLAPARMNGGAEHIVLPLRERSRLAAMEYDLDEGRLLMTRLGLVTIMLVHIENDQTFTSRNAFASGGVLEDPATGAASAAFAGYLRDQGWPHGGSFIINQGEDMGSPSIINVELDDVTGAPVRVSGRTHLMS